MKECGQTFSEKPGWMVVDDDPAVLELVCSCLRMISDAKISGYRSPAEALADVAAEPAAFELVITDFEMPGMNGLEFCRSVRAAAPQVQVALMTGNHAALDSLLAEGSGFSGFLYKPFSLDSLEKLVETLTEHRHNPAVPQTSRAQIN